MCLAFSCSLLKNDLALEPTVVASNRAWIKEFLWSYLQSFAMISDDWTWQCQRKFLEIHTTWKNLELTLSTLPLFWAFWVFISSIIRSIFGPSFYGRRFLQNWGTVQKRAKWWGRKAKTRSIGNPPPLSSRFPSCRARDQVSVNLLIIVDGFPNNSLILTEHGSYNTQKMSAEEKIITLVSANVMPWLRFMFLLALCASKILWSNDV